MNNCFWERVSKCTNLVFCIVLKIQGRIIPGFDHEGVGGSNLIQILYCIPLIIGDIIYTLVPIASEEETDEQDQIGRYDRGSPPWESCTCTCRLTRYYHRIVKKQRCGKEAHK